MQPAGIEAGIGCHDATPLPFVPIQPGGDAMQRVASDDGVSVGWSRGRSFGRRLRRVLPDNFRHRRRGRRLDALRRVFAGEFSGRPGHCLRRLGFLKRRFGLPLDLRAGVCRRVRRKRLHGRRLLRGRGRRLLQRRFFCCPAAQKFRRIGDEDRCERDRQQGRQIANVRPLPTSCSGRPISGGPSVVTLCSRFG